MKGQRYPPGDKIWIWRPADRGEQSIQEWCREGKRPAVTFPRWQEPFGHLEINEARRLKELERENSELKKRLAESLLENRVLGAVCEKSCGSGASPEFRPTSGPRWTMFAAGGVSVSALGAVDLLHLFLSHSEASRY